jgi:hypothetical protein
MKTAQVTVPEVDPARLEAIIQHSRGERAFGDVLYHAAQAAAHLKMLVDALPVGGHWAYRDRGLDVLPFRFAQLPAVWRECAHGLTEFVTETRHRHDLSLKGEQ